MAVLDDISKYFIHYPFMIKLHFCLHKIYQFPTHCFSHEHLTVKHFCYQIIKGITISHYLFLYNQKNILAKKKKNSRGKKYCFSVNNMLITGINNLGEVDLQSPC